MTTKPELNLGRHLLPGLAAGALFVVMSAIILGAPLSAPEGFPGDANITASIGYAMFNIAGQASVPSEGFLVTFEIIDLVLVAALVGAVMLARKEVGGAVVNALSADGESEAGATATDGGERFDESRPSSEPRSDGGESLAAADEVADEGGDR